MLTKEVAKRQILSLQSLGYTLREAFTQVFDSARNRLQKSLPAVERKFQKDDPALERGSLQDFKVPGCCSGTKKTTPQAPGQTGKKDAPPPVSTVYWRVKHPDGTVWDYRLSEVSEQPGPGQEQPKTYTLDQWRKLHEAHVTAHQEVKTAKGDITPAHKPRSTRRSEMRKSRYAPHIFLMKRRTPTMNHRLIDEMQNAEQHASNVLTGRATTQTAPKEITKAAQPTPPAEDPLLKSREFDERNGARMVARKAGLNVTGIPNSQLEKMSFDQMRAAANEQQQKEIQKTRESYNAPRFTADNLPGIFARPMFYPK